MIRAHSSIRNVAAAFVLLALAVRVLVPSGWMPSAETGFALTICNGMDTQTVWMDKSGKLHKEDPSKGKPVEHQPCAFAGPSLAANLPEADLHLTRAPFPSTSAVFAQREIQVGAGLAAPPPPSTGPPSYL